MHGTEIERPLAIVMIGGLVTSTLFTLLALPTFYLFVHDCAERRSQRTAQPQGGIDQSRPRYSLHRPDWAPGCPRLERNR